MDLSFFVTPFRNCNKFKGFFGLPLSSSHSLVKRFGDTNFTWYLFSVNINWLFQQRFKLSSNGTDESTMLLKRIYRYVSLYKREKKLAIRYAWELTVKDVWEHGHFPPLREFLHVQKISFPYFYKPCCQQHHNYFSFKPKYAESFLRLRFDFFLRLLIKTPFDGVAILFWGTSLIFALQISYSFHVLFYSSWRYCAVYLLFAWMNDLLACLKFAKLIWEYVMPPFSLFN